MPGFVTHYLFGVCTYPRIIPESVQDTISREPTVYALGLQGPDVFFYYFLSYLHHPKNIGTIAHNYATGSFFRCLLQNVLACPAGSKEREIAEAYIYGFIGHYTLDTTAHPFIYAFTGFDADNPPSDKEYFGRHTYFETEIDNTLLMKYKHKLPSEFFMNRTIRLSGRQRRVIGNLLARTYIETYREIFPDMKVTPLQIRMGTRWMYVLTRLMNDPWGWKKRLVRALEQKFIGRAMFSPMIPSDTIKFVKDPLNLARRLWIHPWTKTASRSTFEDLFAEARIHYLKRIAACAAVLEGRGDAETFLREYGNKSFSSGLELE